MKVKIALVAVVALAAALAPAVALADSVGLPEHPAATSIRLSTEAAQRKGCDAAVLKQASLEWNIESWRTVRHTLPVTYQLDYNTADFRVVASEEYQPNAAFEFVVDGEVVKPTRTGIIALRLTKGEITADLIFLAVIDPVKYARNVIKCEPKEQA